MAKHIHIHLGDKKFNDGENYSRLNLSLVKNPLGKLITDVYRLQLTVENSKDFSSAKKLEEICKLLKQAETLIDKI